MVHRCKINSLIENKIKIILHIINHDSVKQPIFEWNNLFYFIGIKFENTNPWLVTFILWCPNFEEVGSAALLSLIVALS